MELVHQRERGDFLESVYRTINKFRIQPNKTPKRICRESRSIFKFLLESDGRNDPYGSSLNRSITIKLFQPSLIESEMKERSLVDQVDAERLGESVYQKEKVPHSNDGLINADFLRQIISDSS